MGAIADLIKEIGEFLGRRVEKQETLSDRLAAKTKQLEQARGYIEELINIIENQRREIDYLRSRF